MKTIHKICLDLHTCTSSILLPIPQRDTARTLQIRLTQGGIPYPIPEEAYAVLTAKAPSGSSLPWLACEKQDNSLLCPIPGGHTAQPGLLRCQLRLYSAGEGSLLLTAPEFTLEITAQVCDATDDGAVSPAPDALDTLVSQTLAAAQRADAVAQQLTQDVENGRFQGEKGEKGEKGDKPVAGVDYFTEADKSDFRSALLTDMAYAAIRCRAEGTNLSLSDAATQPFRALTLDTAGLDTGTPVTLTVAGKNLIDPAQFTTRKRTDGDPMIKLGQNWVQPYFGGWAADLYTGTNTPGRAVDVEHLSRLPYLEAGTYTLSYTTSQKDWLTLYLVAETGELAGGYVCQTGQTTFTLEAPSRITLRRTGTNSSATVFYDLQLERGSGATAFAPYVQPQTVTVAATGGTVDVLAQAPGLHSNARSTVVTTQPAVPIRADYMADTKTYIDTRLAALATTLL